MGSRGSAARLREDRCATGKRDIVLSLKIVLTRNLAVIVLLSALASTSAPAYTSPLRTTYIYTPTWGMLEFVGYNDSTHVWIYNLSGGVSRLEDVFTINRMEVYNIRIPPGSFIKIVADKPVFAAGYSCKPGSNESSGGNTYYTCTEGGYIGKEFIFAPVIAKRMIDPALDRHVVFALDRSNVRLYDADGNLLESFTLEPYSYKLLDYRLLKPHRSYRLVSTGRIMLSAWKGQGGNHAPALEGGFSGKTFFAAPGIVDLGVIIIMGSGEAKAIAWGDMPQVYVSGRISPGKPLVKIGLPGRGSLSYTIVQASSGELSVIAGDFSELCGIDVAYIGGDVDVFGCASNETVWLYVPEKGDAVGVVFIPFNDTLLEVDGGFSRHGADETIMLGPGYHQVKPSKPVIIVVTYPSCWGLGKWGSPGSVDWGAALPFPRDLEAVHEVPSLPRKGLPTLYVAAALAIIVALLVAALIIRKKVFR